MLLLRYEITNFLSLELSNRSAHINPSRAMLSPPRLPALCIVFHAFARPAPALASTGVERDL